METILKRVNKVFPQERYLNQTHEELADFLMSEAANSENFDDNDIQKVWIDRSNLQVIIGPWKQLIDNEKMTLVEDDGS